MPSLKFNAVFLVVQFISVLNCSLVQSVFAKNMVLHFNSQWIAVVNVRAILNSNLIICNLHFQIGWTVAKEISNWVYLLETFFRKVFKNEISVFHLWLIATLSKTVKKCLTKGGHCWHAKKCLLASLFLSCLWTFYFKTITN